jgi:hypothetical protein
MSRAGHGRLEDDVAIVTGGGDGIGSAISIPTDVAHARARPQW